MLAEPGWVIPAGRYERRYAALSVSDARMRDRGYFNALHQQIAGGGAEAMMWDLQRMDLGEWHPRNPREFVERFCATGTTNSYAAAIRAMVSVVAKRWSSAGALTNNNPQSKKLSRPSTAYTKSLREDAMQRYPRLRYELSDNIIEEFMTNQSWPKATKFRDSKNNGWTFEPLAESRAEWDRRYGPQAWDDAREWIGRQPWE